jgi:hypothetical protein
MFTKDPILSQLHPVHHLFKSPFYETNLGSMLYSVLKAQVVSPLETFSPNISPMHTTYPTHLIFLDPYMPPTTGEENEF